MEFDVFAAQQHQLAGERFVFDGKFEFVGLDRTGRFGPYAGLDQLAFVGFEDEPFICLLYTSTSRVIRTTRPF